LRRAHNARPPCSSRAQLLSAIIGLAGILGGFSRVVSIVEHSSRRGQKLAITASTVIGFSQSPRKTPRPGAVVSPRDHHTRKRAQSLLAVDVAQVAEWKDGEAEPASPCSDARSTTSGHRTTTGTGRPPSPPPAPPAAFADVEPSDVVVTSAVDSAHSIVPGAPEAAPAAPSREGGELEV